MLLRNYSYINCLCGHNHSGITNPVWIIQPHVMRGYYTPQQNDGNLETLKRDSITTGSYPPYSYILCDVGGLLSATTTLYQSNGFNNLNLAGGLNGVSTWDGTSTLSGQLGALAYLISTISGTSTLSGNIQGAVNIASNLVGSGDLTGALGALISILADLNGSGDLTGDIAGALSAVSALAGSGDLVGAIQGSVSILSDLTGTSTLTSAIIGNWDMIVNISGNGTITANITALAHLICDLISSGDITLTSGTVPGDISCDISSFSTLSPENLAAAVWNALSASFNNTGTMGEIMNNMGAATDPWTVTLEGSYTAGEIMKILVAVAAGKTTITNTGNNSAKVTFRDINDSEDRVKSTMKNSNRESIIINV